MHNPGQNHCNHRGNHRRDNKIQRVHGAIKHGIIRGKANHNKRMQPHPLEITHPDTGNR